MLEHLDEQVLGRGQEVSKKEWKLLHVAVVAIEDTTYVARLFFGDGETKNIVWDCDSRPSDACWLALKVDIHPFYYFTSNGLTLLSAKRWLEEFPHLTFLGSWTLENSDRMSPLRIKMEVENPDGRAESLLWTMMRALELIMTRRTHTRHVQRMQLICRPNVPYTCTRKFGKAMLKPYCKSISIAHL